MSPVDEGEAWTLIDKALINHYVQHKARTLNEWWGVGEGGLIHDVLLILDVSYCFISAFKSQAGQGQPPVDQELIQFSLEALMLESCGWVLVFTPPLKHPYGMESTEMAVSTCRSSSLQIKLHWFTFTDTRSLQKRNSHEQFTCKDRATGQYYSTVFGIAWRFKAGGRIKGRGGKGCKGGRVVCWEFKGSNGIFVWMLHWGTPGWDWAWELHRPPGFL